jgi:hypothetical protein
MSAWSIDRIAALNLLADLGLEHSAENIAKATRHCADHRRHAIRWAAEKAHGTIVGRLEDAATAEFLREHPERAEGYRFAEQQVMTAAPRDLLQLAPEESPSKGQILRHLVRRARGR